MVCRTKVQRKKAQYWNFALPDNSPGWFLTRRTKTQDDISHLCINILSKDVDHYRCKHRRDASIYQFITESCAFVRIDKYHPRLLSVPTKPPWAFVRMCTIPILGFCRLPVKGYPIDILEPACLYRQKFHFYVNVKVLCRILRKQCLMQPII